MNAILEIKNLSKVYKTSKHHIKALNDVSMNISEGEIRAIIGESGSGKTTLGRLILKLENQNSGEILIKGMNHLKLKNRKEFYRKVQMIYQNPYDVFDNNYTIRESLKNVLKIHNIGKEEDREEIIKRYLKLGMLKNSEEFLQRYPREISGGELQRVAIIRSMILKPKILVADEPVTMLDISVRLGILDLIKNISKNNLTSIILITHDISIASLISDKISVMYLGEIVEEGRTEDIIKFPYHPYTKALISNINSIYEKNNNRIKLRGDPPMAVNLGNKCYFSDRCPERREECSHNHYELKSYKDRLVRCVQFM